jgi:hypothetical protein
MVFFFLTFKAKIEENLDKKCLNDSVCWGDYGLVYCSFICKCAVFVSCSVKNKQFLSLAKV